MRNLSRKFAFTLIEIIVSVIILSVLSVIGITKYNELIRRQTERKAYFKYQEFKAAMDIQKVKRGRYLEAGDVVNGYTIPLAYGNTGTCNIHDNTDCTDALGITQDGFDISCYTNGSNYQLWVQKHPEMSLYYEATWENPKCRIDICPTCRCPSCPESDPDCEIIYDY